MTAHPSPTRRILARLAGLALIGAIAAGCSTATPDTTPTPAPAPAATAMPQKTAAETAAMLRTLLEQAGAVPGEYDKIARDAAGNLVISGAFPGSHNERLRIYEADSIDALPTCSNENGIHTWDMVGDGWWAVIDGGDEIENFPVKPETIAERLGVELLPLCPGAQTP